MPAVLSGVTAVITSAVAVLCVILATLSSSPAGSLFFVAFFAYIFSSVCVAIIRRVPVRGRRMIIVDVITFRRARRVTIPAVSSSLTSTVDSTGVSRFLVRCRIQRALVAAYIIFASRTFIFSGNFITNLHGMVRRCTDCCIFEFRGAVIALLVIRQSSFERVVLLICECPEERVSLARGNCDITERFQLDTNAAQFLDYSSRVIFVSRGHL